MNSMNSIVLPVIISVFVLCILSMFVFFVRYLSKGNEYCQKCHRKVKDVDNYYYLKRFKESRNRARCSLHPLEGYQKIYIENKHYKTELRKLSLGKEEIKKITNSKEDYIIVIKDFGFAKILKTFKPQLKTIIIELQFDNRKLTIEDKKSGIYLITEKETGKPYVGKSMNISKRWTQHQVSSSNDGFHETLKANPGNFEYQVLMNCPREMLDFFEAYFILKYNSYNNGFNLTKGNYSHLKENEIKILNKFNDI